MVTDNELQRRKKISETFKKKKLGFISNPEHIKPNPFIKGHTATRGAFQKGHKINWRGGISRNQAYRIIQKLYCRNCGKDNIKLTIHHKDKNPKNNNIENLEVLCFKCHIGLHNKERKSWLNLPFHKNKLEKDKIS